MVRVCKSQVPANSNNLMYHRIQALMYVARVLTLPLGACLPANIARVLGFSGTLVAGLYIMTSRYRHAPAIASGWLTPTHVCNSFVRRHFPSDCGLTCTSRKGVNDDRGVRAGRADQLSGGLDDLIRGHTRTPGLPHRIHNLSGDAQRCSTDHSIAAYKWNI